MLGRFFRQHSLTSHLLVFLQLIGVFLCCYPVGLANSGSPYSLILCGLGSVLGIWSLCVNKIGNFSVYPEIKPQAILITNGPYRYIRHPMYSALMIMMIGIALYNFHTLNALGVILVCFAVLNKSNIEEKFLQRRFEEYQNYRLNCKRFLPYLY